MDLKFLTACVEKSQNSSDTVFFFSDVEMPIKEEVFKH